MLSHIAGVLMGFSVMTILFSFYQKRTRPESLKQSKLIMNVGIVLLVVSVLFTLPDIIQRFK
jgi:predicted permease